MKKRSFAKRIAATAIVCMLLVFLCSCMLSYRSREILYYSQEENYISITATMINAKYSEQFPDRLIVNLTEMSTTLDDNCFKIVGENLRIVEASEAFDKLQPGQQITIITAPRYFGDGYIYPIVGLSIDGQTLLEFDEGYQNFLSWLTVN